MSRKKVLLASSFTLCSTSASLAAAGTGKYPVFADGLINQKEPAKQEAMTSETGQHYLGALSAVATDRVLAEIKESQPLTYSVKKGDTLFRIGLYYGVHYQKIAAYNRLQNPDLIFPNQRLKIPLVPQWHQAKKGETLSTLAQKHQTTSALLGHLNPQVRDKHQDLQGEWVMIVNQIKVPTSMPAEQKRQHKKVKVLKRPMEEKPVFSHSHRFQWPVEGRVTSNFGWRHGRMHKGTDIWNVARSNCHIRASLGGVVIRSGYSRGYGNLVVIDHGNGWQTYYAHLSRIGVSKGQRVGTGEWLGNMGQTGNATGYHLHFEIRKDGRAINPLSLLP